MRIQYVERCHNPQEALQLLLGPGGLEVLNLLQLCVLRCKDYFLPTGIQFHATEDDTGIQLKLLAADLHVLLQTVLEED